MRRALLFLVVVWVSLSMSCGNPTILQSISISPSGVTFTGTGAGATAQLTAYGSFIHPTETRDITTQVTWSSAIPDVATVDANGLVTTGPACGSTVITATADHKLVGVGSSVGIVTGTATITIKEPGNVNCP